MATSNDYQLRLDWFSDKDGEGTVTYRCYTTLEGRRKRLISKVGDGRIIKRFDKTGTAVGGEDIVCPHFLELKWAYGCPLQCAYCYLQGTLRFLPGKKAPKPRSLEDVEVAVKRFLEEAKDPEILNSGELADSLMYERNDSALSKRVLPLFRGKKHKVLIVTKLDWIDNLLTLDEDLKKNVVVSFSVNSRPVAERWEVGAPDPMKRVEAAGKLQDAGYVVRIRIDPIVPYPERWLDGYAELIDSIFRRLEPERITVGSLRGLQSTINNAKDRSWAEYLSDRSKWGRRIPFEKRLDLFSTVIQYIQNVHNYNNLALCKEPVMMWEALGMNWKSCRCNCTC
ncbi:MAG: radical SAM protein [Candidatus Methanosuratincola petrocarbonis]